MKTLPTPTMQAPEATTGAASGDTETVRKQVAKHELLDTAGAVVENEEEANGVRYTLLANNGVFEYQFGKSAEADKLLALFGAKTLATNESSASRNSTKGEGSPDEQIEAVRERFALLQTGKWVDRTREGVGAKIDLDRLANAIANVQVAAGMYTEEQAKTEKVAKLRAKLEEDKAWGRKARQQPEFAAEYAKLGGAALASVDDFAV